MRELELGNGTENKNGKAISCKPSEQFEMVRKRKCVFFFVFLPFLFFFSHEIDILIKRGN